MGRKNRDDAASESSAGSASSAGSRASNDEKAANVGQEEAQEDLLDANQSVVWDVFGVLNTVLGSVKYDAMLRFTVARIILEFVQLLLLVLRPYYGFDINEHLWVWQAIKWVEFANPLTSDGYTFYITWIYVGVAIMACSLIVAIWVGWCNTKRYFPVIWPVMLLRLVLNATVFVFYISCFSVFLAAFNCNWFMEGQGEVETSPGTKEMVDLRFRLHRFPEVECLELPHLVHGVIALAACAMFTLIAYAATLTEFEPDPSSRRFMATPHSFVEVWALTLKTIMALNMAIFAGQLYVQSVIMCLATLSLCYLYIRWQPYLNEWVNHIRSGLYCMLFWVSVFMAIMKFDHRRDTAGYSEWITEIMLIGLGPILVFGFFLSFFRLRLLQWLVLKAIRHAPADTSDQAMLRAVYRFRNAMEVEIASRILRRWSPEDDEVLDPEAVKLADLIMKIGVALFPDDPYLVIIYSNFLINVQINYQVGTSQLQRVSKLEDSSMCDNYIAFVKSQEAKLRAQSLNQAPGESALDLVAYVEFQRNFRLLARTHRGALVALRNFWLLLLHQDVPFAKVAEAMEAIQKTGTKADKTFKVLLNRYPDDVKLLRGYARFLEHVRSDPWTASKFASAADRLDEEQGGNNAAALLAQSDSAGMLESVNEKTSAVVVINAEGLIKVANRLTQKLLGYKKSEMEGKNVSMIMPPPFSHRHNGYLRTHISSGKKRILDSVREVVALHKDQYVFPIQLAVTKVSGVGADSMFMGVMRRYQVEPGIIRVWIMPSGAVISVDDRFMDSFGKSFKDVAGRMFQSLTADQDTIIKLLSRAQAASEEDFKSGKVAAKDVSVLHQYMDPVMVDIDVGLGGSDSQRVLALNLRPKEAAGKLMVTDAKGRLIYLNNEMRALLGHPASALNKMDLSQIMPFPCALLHTKWIREPSAKKPKQSCRSSATVVLMDANGQNIPIKPTIVTCEVEDTVQHVVHVHPSTREQGLDERRLVLTLDTQGTVLKTSNAHSSLFGFRPSLLIGQNVSSIVDVLGELHKELTSVLSKMAQKVIAKPGYSWRVGVHPPDSQEFSILGPMERQARIRSTQPALMQFELVQHEEDDIPEIKMLLYKADMIGAVIESDALGIIVRPSVNLLNPSGLIFGCSERSMTRRPLRNYIQMPTKHPDTLLQDDKAKKGAMKSGRTGLKVGPLKFMNGIHVDGSSLELKVLAISTKDSHIMVKVAFSVLENGDVALFQRTLATSDELSRSRRASRISELGAAQKRNNWSGDGLAGKVSGSGVQLQGMNPGSKAVKFANDLVEDAESISQSSDGEEDPEEEEEAEAEEEVVEPGEENEEEGTESEADSPASGPVPDVFTTDWARGRRLKKLHTLLHNKLAQTDYLNFKSQMLWIPGLLLGVHLALFIAYLVITNDLVATIRELDANGQLIVNSVTLTIIARKIYNLYQGKTNPNIYEMTPEELQLTIEHLGLTITQTETMQEGVYLGFNGLRQLKTAYGLRAIWEGDSLEDQLYIDVRMPRLEEEHGNLWSLGNALIAAARELYQNHAAIAIETNNNFTLDRNWRYIIDNGLDVLANSYTQSLDSMLQRDFSQINAIKAACQAFLAVDLVVIATCMIWCWILLKNVQSTRHRLTSVFLSIPTSFLKALAIRQMQIADQDDEGGGEDDDDDEAANLLKGTQGSPGDANQPAGVAAAGPSKEKEAKAAQAAVTAKLKGETLAGKAFVVDVDALVQGHNHAKGANANGFVTIPLWKWLLYKLKEPPIVVGKRKLLRFNRDSYILMAPLAIWFILVLAISEVSIQRQIGLKTPLTNNFLANRLAAYSAWTVADAHRVFSVDYLDDVRTAKEGMDSRLAKLVHMYTSMLYGSADPGNMTFIPLNGVLFDNVATQDAFFHYSGCKVTWRPQKYCFDNETDRFYQAATHGIDAMMLRLIDESNMTLDQTDEFTLEVGLSSKPIDYIWNVAWHALQGSLSDVSKLYSAQAHAQFSAAQTPQIALFALSWVLAAAYIYFLFKPFKTVLDYETRQVAELLSQLPSEVNVAFACAKALNLPDPN